MDKIDADKINVINESPYDGIAIRMIWEFDDKPLDFDRLKKSAEFLKINSKKQIWPWVFLNRIVGVNEKEKPQKIIKDKPYFLKIKGIDIYDATGALSDFYQIWRSSLKLAKKLSSPGIVFDIEAYNKYEVNKISYLAKLNNKTNAEIKNRLKKIGTDLIQIVSEENPDIIIWFLFTHLADPPPSWYPSEEKYMSVSYIVESMLSEAKMMKLPMKFIDGGQVGLGYCYLSLDDMREKILRRQERFNPILLRYPSLYLGGTIAPWNDIAVKKGWMTEKICAESGLKTMSEFVPLIRTLTENYDYVWIYATQMAGYEPYDSRTATPFNSGIQKLIKDRGITKR